MENLLECPFCENKDISISYNDNSLVWKLYCSVCGVSYSHINKEKIIKFWNSRPREKSLQERINLSRENEEKITTSYDSSYAYLKNEYDTLQNKMDILKKEMQENIVSYNNIQNKYNILQESFNENEEIKKQEINALQTKVKDIQKMHQNYVEGVQADNSAKLRDAQIKIDKLKSDMESARLSLIDIKYKYDVLQKSFDKYIESSKKENIALQTSLDNEKIKHQQYIDSAQSAISAIEEKLRKVILSYNSKLDNVKLDENKIIENVIGKAKRK